jgi:molybdate transport system substrate-binding protein
VPFNSQHGKSSRFDWRAAFQRTALVVLAVALFIPFAHAQQKQIRVAAASDLQFAIPELAARFKATSGIEVVPSFGSSGNFFSQIQNGAPFDLFFSADIDYPRKLDAAGLCETGTLYEYATGKIVLWAPKNTPLDVASQGWQALLDSRAQKIAVANPAHAPYGRAAVAAMRKAGIYDRVQGKIVYGENISQTAQFVQSGNAQVGVVALSLAASPAMKDGQSWEVPADLYPSLEQAAVILKVSKAKDSAKAFLEFVRGAEGREILAKYGFQVSKVS